MENSFARRRTIAFQEEARIEATEKAGARKRSFRGIRTIYHDEFPPYFNWVVAKITLVKRHDTFDLHLHCYGIPLKLYELEAYLEELLGQKFETLFGFRAGRAEYQYLDDVLAMGLKKLSAEAEDPDIDLLNLNRVRAWLAEQIARTKNAPVSPMGTAGSNDEHAQDTPSSVYSPWSALLDTARLPLEDFFTFLETCGLLYPDGKLTPLGKGDDLGKARKAPWVGTLQALISAQLLDPNMAAICRALAVPEGKLQVKLADNTLLEPSRKSRTYQQVAEVKLRELGYPRN